jgi:hypothetical protein
MYASALKPSLLGHPSPPTDYQSQVPDIDLGPTVTPSYLNMGKIMMGIGQGSFL